MLNNAGGDGWLFGGQDCVAFRTTAGVVARNRRGTDATRWPSAMESFVVAPRQALAELVWPTLFDADHRSDAVVRRTSKTCKPIRSSEALFMFVETADEASNGALYRRAGTAAAVTLVEMWRVLALPGVAVVPALRVLPVLYL